MKQMGQKVPNYLLTRPHKVDLILGDDVACSAV